MTYETQFIVPPNSRQNVRDRERLLYLEVSLYYNIIKCIHDDVACINIMYCTYIYVWRCRRRGLCGWRFEPQYYLSPPRGERHATTYISPFGADKEEKKNKEKFYTSFKGKQIVAVPPVKRTHRPQHTHTHL